MSIITRIDYNNDKQITALYTQLNDQHTWVAFAQNSSGNCIIEKQFSSDPLQTFFSFSRNVQSVNSMDSDGSNLFLAYTDNTLFGELISLTNPLTTSTQILFPIGINESPIAVKVDGSNIWFLTPGIAMGENAKLVLFDSNGVFQETVDLTTINNASTLTTAVNNDVWIFTNTAPTKTIRVFLVLGVYNIQIT